MSLKKKFWKNPDITKVGIGVSEQHTIHLGPNLEGLK